MKNRHKVLQKELFVSFAISFKTNKLNDREDTILWKNGFKAAHSSQGRDDLHHFQVVTDINVCFVVAKAA